MDDARWAAIGRCLRRFHDAGVQHADLNAQNIMLGAQGEVWVLDFDRGRLREPGAWRERVLDRLARSLAKIGDQRDRLAGRLCAAAPRARRLTRCPGSTTCSSISRRRSRSWCSSGASLRDPSYREGLGERFGFGAPSTARRSGSMPCRSARCRRRNRWWSSCIARHPAYRLVLTTVTPTGRRAGAAAVRRPRAAALRALRPAGLGEALLRPRAAASSR